MAKENHKLKWRLLVKYLTCIDLVLVGVGLTLAYICAANAVDSGMIIYLGDEKQLCDNERIEMATLTKYLLIVAIFVLGCLGITADVLLLNSTEMGEDVELAAAGARVWKILNLTVLVLHFADMFINGPYDIGVATFIWHLVLLFIVSEYINELDVAVERLYKVDVTIVQGKKCQQKHEVNDAVAVVVFG